MTQCNFLDCLASHVAIFHRTHQDLRKTSIGSDALFETIVPVAEFTGLSDTISADSLAIWI